jgi:aspartyl-tRNA(Asn)/glutamyl-tRNA(Gln) amidotransferase subunit C
MSLTPEDIEKLASLCRISCSPQEKEGLTGSLEALRRYFQQLKEIDTEGVTPCYTPQTPSSDWLRDDRCDPLLPRDRFLSNAAEHIGGMVKVPPILIPK